MDYKKIYTQPFAPEESKKSSDELEWSHFDFPKTVKDYYAIEHIDVCQIAPFPVAITAGSKVVVCETETRPPDHIISRFHKNAYGAKFRSDRKLLAVGTEENEVKLFDYKKKTLLRTFNGHTCPVHRVDFIRGKPEIVSFSDDKSVSIWDIAGESLKETFSGHTSMIRAGVASPTSENIVVSGSYDQTVKLWDSRVQYDVKTFSHGSIVEALLFFPNGTRFASAGGCDLRIWDLVAGKQVKTFSNHHKSITSLAFVSKTNTLLSGSLDKHVKIYSMDKLKYLHTLSNYSAPILSLGVTDTASTLIVGMSAGDSGLISFQHANRKKKSSMIAEEKNKHDIHNRLKLQNCKEKTAEGTTQFLKCEAHLRKFNYSDCMKVLCNNRSLSQPQNVVAIFQKLIQLDVLKMVLPICSRNVIPFVMDFTVKYLNVPSYTRILEIVTDILLDLYEETSDKKMYDDFIKRLLNVCDAHIDSMDELEESRSMAVMFLGVKIVQQSNTTEVIEIQEKKPAPPEEHKPRGKRKAIFEVLE